jgi:PAS domain S-box-containing protein
VFSPVSSLRLPWLRPAPAWLRLVLLIGLVVPGFAAEPARAVLRVGLEANSEPFTFADSSGQHTGFAYDLLRAVAEDQKLELEYVMLPWNDVLSEFKAGRLDIICNLVDTPERHAYIDFSATTILLRGAVYTRRDAPPLSSVADLRGRSVATIRNSRSHEYLRNQDWGVEFQYMPTMFDCVDAVHEGRADLFVATQMVSDYQIRQRGYTDLRLAPLTLPDFEYREHFGVQPGQAQLLAKLNDGLLTVQRNGTYDRLYEKWIGPIESRAVRWRDIQPYALPLLMLLATVLVGLAWQRRVLARVRRQAEALRQSEEQLSLVIEGSQDGFWDWDLRTGIVTRSPRWAEIVGFSVAEVAASREGFLDRIHPEDRARVEADEHSVWKGRDRFETEFRMQARSGEWKWILDRGKVVVRNPATGEPWRIAGTHTDITARKVAEQENEKLNHKMLETQKLESLGVLAGGIAHDFNNLLTVILGNASISRLEPGISKEERERLGTIVTAAQRAADLCRQLLAYAGKGAFVIERLDLNRVAQETARLLELSVHTCTLEYHLAPALPAIEADVSQIRQIIMNLVLNAAEAIGSQPGRIRITTSAVTLRDGDLPDALPAGTHLAGAFVRLEISDNGSGMAPDVLQRIFDPFYTTKFAGRGLGLAAVLGIVRSHDGALTVHSDVGLGSTFRVYLPATAGAPVATIPTTSAVPAPAGSSTVLVADDEDSVRALITALLRRVGYTVVAVETGDEALRRFTAEPDRFQLALLDITMPGIDGLSALRRMRELRPALPCVILSGHSEQDAAGPFGGTGATTFLQKPFEIADLMQALARVKPVA